MAWGTCALALLCALVAGAVAYTVDCNHEYTDCDTELSKLTSEDDDTASTLPPMPPRIVETSSPDTTSTTPAPTRTTPTAKDQNVNVTDVQVTTEINEVTEPIAKPKPRLLNLNVEELQNFANVLHNQTKGIKKTIDDLSDVNLDEDVNERDYGPESRNKQIPDKFYSNLQTPFNPLMNVDKSEETEICKESGVAYKVGEHIDRGCEESCECTPSGVFECLPRCKHPFIRRGRRLNDPLCFESPVDECCSIVACVTANGETKPVPLEVCSYGNETYTTGEKWHIGCAQTCSCERNSVVTCRPRCDPLPQSDKCINVQDPTDECCEMQICDVSQDAHEEHENVTNTSSTKEVPQKTSDLASLPPRPLVLTEPIGSIKVLQNNTVQVNLMHVNNSEDPIHLLLSSDGGNTFHEIELKYSNLILNLEGGKDYILKTKETGTKFNFTVTASDVGNEVPVEETVNGKEGCYHDGKFYNVGDEFHIGCSELCECTGADTRECAPLQCPTHVGLELVSRGCVQWAPSPPARPPDCCPRTARCLSDGTCHYKGVPIPNWTEVPISLTGCEEHCFCENGSLDCQEACAPLPALPPPSLRCAPRMHPAPVNASDDDCCKVWGCVPSGQMPPGLTNLPPPTPPTFLPTIPSNDRYPSEDIDYDQNNIHRPINPLEPIPGLPPGLPIPNYGGGDDNKKLQVLALQGDSPTSIKMLFGLPPVLVGLRGSVDLRYTDTADEDITQWFSQVFAPADEILTTQRLEFRLTGLKPSTTYKIRGKLFLHNLPVEPESEIYTVRTQDLPTFAPPEEKRKQIDCKLTVVEVNDTSAYLSWRHFTEEELQYIDGIQVRYRPTGTPIYSTTELLHHSRSGAALPDLRPHSRYEAALVLAPPPHAHSELYDPAVVEFNTLPLIDPYNWTVTITAHEVGATSARISWRGAPSPAERWVRVYRAAHACREERDAFRLAARDAPEAITLSGLEPDSRCRVWLELFLTNGKVKTSNVLEIHTKPLDSDEPIDNTIEASSVRARGDYYSALVAVGAVAALAALVAALLLLVVLRRHRPRSVAITSVPSAPRESSLPPYDNPAYKLELQQETMNL